MKRLALIFSMVFITASVLPTPALSQIVVTDHVLYYEVYSDGTAKVVPPAYYTTDYVSGSITIPEKTEFEGKTYNITTIGRNAFSSCKSLMSVRIPNSVINIEGEVFSYCTSLMNVTLPISLQSIGAEAFKDCKSLENIVIPDSVTFIGVNAFSDCSSLKTITIPFSASLGNGVFKYCRALSKIIVSSDSYYTSSSLQEKYSSAISQIDTFRPRNVAIELATTNKSVNQATANNNNSSNQNDSEFSKQLRLAEQGSAVAQNYVGWCYEYGKGVEQNYSEAFKWYMKSAEQGHMRAQNHIGYLYYKGNGVEQSYSEAFKWYMKAAEQGYDVAQYNVGVFYGGGYGVLQNYSEAFKWYMKAASQEYSPAYNAVAYLYMEGNGVKKDEGEAFEMIDKAIELSPNNTSYYDSKGEFYSMLGDEEHAMEMWNKIMSLDPNYAEKYDTNFITYIRKLQGGVDFNIPKTNYNNNTTFAVIIANESYNREEDVSYALNDGEIFSEYCSKTLGIPEKNLHLIKNATLNDIRHEVNWVTNVMDAYSGDAKVIFYYAGHGIPDERTKAAYLLPVDGYGSDVTTGYSLSDLYSTLGGVPSKSVIVLLDACFSGAKRDGTMLASSRGVAIKVNQENPIGNLIVFSASQGDETAFPYVEQGHGMFTYFILKKLQETKGNVTMGELSDYVTTQVKRESAVINNKPQTPTLIPAQTIATTWRNETIR